MKLTQENLLAQISEAVGKAFAERVEADRKKAIESATPEGQIRRYVDLANMNLAKQFSGKSKVPLSKKPIEEMTAEEKGLLAARCLRYQWIAGKGNVELALTLAQKADDTNCFEAMGKAFAESTLSGGGALIPPDFSQGIIDLLYARAVMRKAGVTVYPMPRGSLTLPYISAGSTAAYVGEGSNITSSQPTVGDLNLFWHKLAALIPVSNDLLTDGGPVVDAKLRNDLVNAFAAKEDITFIRSTGESGEPQGMKALVDTGNIIHANTTETIATANAELAQAEQLLQEANVGMGDLTGAAWVMAPRTENALKNAKTSTGQKAWPEMGDGKLNGHPYFVSSQIPRTLGGASQSEVYLAHMPTLCIAESNELQIEMFPNGTYYDGSAVQSGISKDQSVMRGIARHDFGAQQRGKEIVLIDTVEWGKSTFA